MRLPSSGFTIVESLMVLAISGLLFASVSTLISGKQAENEFNTTVRDFESKIQDVLNDVATGYYPSADRISCTASAGSYNITNPGSGEKGTNDSCTFVGKAIQFAPAGAGQEGKMPIYTIVGTRQYVSGGEIKEPRDITEANPALPSDPNALSDSYNLNSSLVFRDVIIGSSHNQGGFAMLGSFGSTTGSERASVVSTGSSETSISHLSGFGLNSGYSNVVSAVNGLSPSDAITDKIIICIGDNGAGRRAAVTITGRGTDVLMGQDSIDEGCPA